jgi:hypothetical protein
MRRFIMIRVMQSRPAASGTLPPAAAIACSTTRCQSDRDATRVDQPPRQVARSNPPSRSIV